MTGVLADPAVGGRPRAGGAGDGRAPPRRGRRYARTELLEAAAEARAARRDAVRRRDHSRAARRARHARSRSTAARSEDRRPAARLAVAGAADVALFHEFAPPPSGGGNQFLRALVGELERRGLDGRGEPDLGAGRTPASSTRSTSTSRRLRRFARDDVRIVHRVDGPIGDVPRIRRRDRRAHRRDQRASSRTRRSSSRATASTRTASSASSSSTRV